MQHIMDPMDHLQHKMQHKQHRVHHKLHRLVESILWGLSEERQRPAIGVAATKIPKMADFIVRSVM